ncbi:kinesin light [Pochonia chlamydosporia 170]|uniref:Kinesin light n=1 Tax=Pochonia chlamydosporia 170 TaxID=1380566 RepID=A0A179FUL2_METCM|nr:kinesin light [Pochonia chlamydosporia 170]OAQ69057.1 kinesin light [Pochonia chlamydosporia 170]
MAPPTRDLCTVGWIAPMSLELAPGRAMLEDCQRVSAGGKYYDVGRLSGHWVVMIVCSRIGNSSATMAVADMRHWFPNIKHILVVGIAGGQPCYGTGGKEQIVLGDVVVGVPRGSEGGVAHYECGAWEAADLFSASGHTLHPSDDLLTAVNTLQGDYIRSGSEIPRFLVELRAKLELDEQAEYNDQGADNDFLFPDTYRHSNRDMDCEGLCDFTAAKKRADRGIKAQRKENSPRIHYGNIASGNALIISSEKRNAFYEKYQVLCFEMESAGVMHHNQALVIRGICDYADSHKNKRWQKYAAATAAAYAKEVLLLVPPAETSNRGEPAQIVARCHFLVPFGRNQEFVGRTEILSQLQERIWPGKNKDDCQRTAVEGLGGVGKTQIALEAVYRVHKEHPDCSIFWVPAVDVNTFENAYRDIGRQMKIAGIDEDKADVKQLVKTALSDDSSGSWLLVVDNADDITLLFGVTRLSDYLPFSRNGSILFTTRNHEAAVKLVVHNSGIVPVLEMDRSEAFDLLRKGLNESQISDTKSTKRLLDFLAYLPLAIRQASAYMAKKQISTSEYLELLATTWLISFNHISKHDPLAAEYLKFMSLLAEKDIPKSLLPTARKIEALEAIGTLKAYAFITQREGQDSFDMHRLVRLAMQNWLKNEGLKSCVSSAIQQLDQAFPFPEHENRDMWMKYLPHARAALEFREHLEGGKVDASLLYNVAQSYSLLGQYQKAEQMYRQTLQLHEKVLGKSHPDTLSSMNNLAEVLSDLGKYKEAKQMHWQTLQLKEKVLGKEHPSTLNSMNNLAGVLLNLGKSKEAEQMQRQEWKLTEKVLGKEHPSTLISMNNVALVLSDLGKYEEAEQMHRQEWKLTEKVLGKEHPSTLISMDNLALVLKKLGKYKVAEQMHRQTLQLYEKVLGKEHPSTLNSMNNLAEVLSDLGKYKEAKQMHWQTLQLKEKVLGKEHPDTLSSMNNLANMLSKLGRYKEAEQMHRQTLLLIEKVLGKDHPSTRTSQRNLDDCLRVKR